MYILWFFVIFGSDLSFVNAIYLILLKYLLVLWNIQYHHVTVFPFDYKVVYILSGVSLFVKLFIMVEKIMTNEHMIYNRNLILNSVEKHTNHSDSQKQCRTSSYLALKNQLKVCIANKIYKCLCFHSQIQYN